MQAQALRARTLATSIFDLSRGRQALLSVAQPALGALLAIGAIPSPRVVVLGLVAATTGFLAVFSLNDVLDRDVDVRSLAAEQTEAGAFDLDVVFSRHPLAAGSLSFAVSVAWVATLAVVSAVCAFLLSPVCLMLFGAAVALEVLYCEMRSVSWLKTVVSGVMVGVGGLAGWAAVAPLSLAAGPFFAFLALWEIGGRNLPNDLADLSADSSVGLKTVSTVFGPRVAARATAAVAVATVAAMLLLDVSPVVGLVCVGAWAWSMGVPAWALLRDPTSEQAGAYFNRASLLPALVFLVVLVGVLAG